MKTTDILNIVSFALLVVFIVIIVGLVLSAISGFKKGIFKSAFKLIFMAVLLITSALTLEPLMKLIYTISLDPFFKAETIAIYANSNESLVYYAQITNIYDTSYQILEGIYSVCNVHASAHDAHIFALAFTGAVLKLCLFTTEISLTVSLGNGLAELLWSTIFVRLVPKYFRRKGKIGGALINTVKFACLAVLFMSPLTIFTNITNQNYQRVKKSTGDAQVSEVGSFLDAYNSSLFAQLFFNWSVNADGLTFDAALLDQFTTSTIEGAEISLVDELNNLVGLATPVIDCFAGLDNEFNFNYATLLTEETIDNTFECLRKSNLLVLMLPIAAQIVTNSDLTKASFDMSHIDASDIDWENELLQLQNFTHNLMSTGILDELFDADSGQFVAPDNAKVKEIVKNMLNDKRDANEPNKPAPFEAILDSFKNISNTKVFDKAISALLDWALLQDKTGELKKMIPLGWDDISKISWGSECYILLDSLHELYKIDEGIVDVIFTATDKKVDNPETPEDESKGNNLDSLFTFISDKCSNATSFKQFKRAFVGEIDTNKLDKNGRSIVFENGNKIEDRHFCLLDMSIFRSVAIPFLNNMLEQKFMTNSLSIDEEDSNFLKETIDDLNKGKYLLNYKNEFDVVLDVAGILASDKALLTAIGNNFNGFIKDNNIFSIDKSHIEYLKKAAKKIDDSKLLYATLTPILKGFITKPDMDVAFRDFGISNQLIGIGMKHDMKRENHQLYDELSQLFDLWDEVQFVTDLISSGTDVSNILNKLSTDEAKISISKTLCFFQTATFFNPDPQSGDKIVFEHNENFFNVMEMVFSYMESIDIKVTREDLRAVETNGHKWANEFDGDTPLINSSDGKYGEIYSICSIIQYIGQRKIVDGVIGGSDLTNPTTLRRFANDGADDYDLPGILERVDSSVLFSRIMGGFLDAQFAPTGIFESNDAMNLTFNNVDSWTLEGRNLGKMLNALADVIEDIGPDFMTDFDITKVNDIPKLNYLFHTLANSGIFKERQTDGTYRYTFGMFLFNKVKPVLSNVDLDGQKDFLKDPKNWSSLYGDRGVNGDEFFNEYYNYFASEEEKSGTSNTYYLAYRDFANLNGDSCLETWGEMATFEAMSESVFIDYNAWSNDNTYHALYGSDNFVNAYQDIFDLDEIGKVCEILTYSLRLINLPDISVDTITADMLQDILYSFNDSKCLKIAVYNLAEVTKEIVNNDASARKIINLDAAYTDYYIYGDLSFDNYEGAKQNRKIEIDYFVDAIRTYQNLKAKHIIVDSTFDIDNLDSESLEDIYDMLVELNKSIVFHRHGSSLNIEGYNPTVYQSLMHNVLEGTAIKKVIYSDSSPKDNAFNETYQKYIDKPLAIATQNEKSMAKIDYLMDSIYLSDDDYVANGIYGYSREIGYQEQLDEIYNFITVIACCYGYEFDGITHTRLLDSYSELTSVNPKTVEPDKIGEVLKELNSSELLYDCTPNLIKSFLNNASFASDVTIDFNDASPFYHYDYNGALPLDYNRKFDDDEIDRLIEIVIDYQQFSEIVDEGSLSAKNTVAALQEQNIFENLLTHTHESEMFHLYNQYNVDTADNNQLTVFEQIASILIVKSSLSNYAFDPVRDVAYGNATNKLNTQLKALSRLERYGGSPLYSYHNAWEGEDQEIKALVNFVDYALTLCDTTIDFTEMDLTKKTPTQLATLLQKMNNCDIIADAVPYFTRDLLENVQVDQLCEFAGTNYAYYYFNQKVYGGENGLAGEGTEIWLIKQAMENFSYKVGDEQRYYDVSDITSLANNVSNFDSIFRFLSDSAIINTRKSDGSKNLLNTLPGGAKISARGVVVYNFLNGVNSSADCLDFITGSGDSEKIHVLSKIFTLDNYSYLAESKAIYKLMKNYDIINTSTIDTTNFNSIKTYANTISNLLPYTYNAYNGNRSYFLSEIIGGIFESSITSERTRINNLGLTDGNPLFTFKPTSYSDVTMDSYNNLNENNKLGFDGIVSLIDYLEKLTTYPLPSDFNRTNLINAFSKMENSDLAKLYYTSRGHKHLSSESYRLDFTQSLLAKSYYGETWNDYALGNNVWDNSFSFVAYGNSLCNYLGL